MYEAKASVCLINVMYNCVCTTQLNALLYEWSQNRVIVEL